MEYFKIGTTNEIKEGTAKAFRVGEHDIVVFNYQGRYYALRRWCSHMGGDLSGGVVEGKVVICPRHGSQFDITTGKSLRGPKIGPFQLSTNDEITYPISIDKEDLMVGIEDKNMMP